MIGDNNEDVIFNLIMVIAMLLTWPVMQDNGDDGHDEDGDNNDDVILNLTMMTMTIATVPTWPAFSATQAAQFFTVELTRGG